MAVDKLEVGKKYAYENYTYVVISVGKEKVFASYNHRKSVLKGELAFGLEAALNHWTEYVPQKVKRTMYASIVCPIVGEPWVFQACLFKTKKELGDAKYIATVTWEEGADEND